MGYIMWPMAISLHIVQLLFFFCIVFSVLSGTYTIVVIIYEMISFCLHALINK